MSSTQNSYNIWTFFDAEKNIEYLIDTEEKTLFKNGIDTKITHTPFKVLVLLVENAGKLVSDEKFFEEVWNKKYLSKNALTVQINFLRNLFDDNDQQTIIETRSNRGYRFTLEVKSQEKPVKTETKFQDVSGATVNSRRIKSDVSKTPKQKLFILAASIFYGLLFGTALLLECAYEFDKYGRNVAIVMLPVIFLNSGAMFLALKEIGKIPHDINNLVFWKGVGFLIIGASLACVLAYIVLPNSPVTAAKFQTQPAFTAFCKNVFIYFLPLYVGFIILPFYFLNRPFETAKSVVFPLVLFIIWIFLLCFSYISTNYLLDNLLTERNGEQYEYHGLFTFLIFLRGVLCFGPALISIIWYFLSRLK